jgi:hypothetical protein
VCTIDYTVVRQLILILCVTTKILCALTILHTPYVPLLGMFTPRTLLCVCTPCNAKFNACTRTPIFISTRRQNLRAHLHANIFRVAPKFSMHTNMPISCHTVTNFRHHKISTAHQFLMHSVHKLRLLLNVFPNLP